MFFRTHNHIPSVEQKFKVEIETLAFSSWVALEVEVMKDVSEMKEGQEWENQEETGKETQSMTSCVEGEAHLGAQGDIKQEK